MEKELFRERHLLISTDVFQVGLASVSIDEIERYAFELDRTGPLERAERIGADTTANLFGRVLILCLAIGIYEFYAYNRFGSFDWFLLGCFGVALTGVLGWFFWPRPVVRHCLSVVDLSGQMLRFCSADQRTVADATKALEQAIEAHYARYPNAARPRRVESTF